MSNSFALYVENLNGSDRKLIDFYPTAREAALRVGASEKGWGFAVKLGGLWHGTGGGECVVGSKRWVCTQVERQSDNRVEQALLDIAYTVLPDFKAGDPGKHVQTLVPTPEWKAFSKAAGDRGVSISLMTRLALRQYIGWLNVMRTPAEIAVEEKVSC